MNSPKVKGYIGKKNAFEPEGQYFKSYGDGYVMSKTNAHVYTAHELLHWVNCSVTWGRKDTTTWLVVYE